MAGKDATGRSHVQTATRFQGFAAGWPAFRCCARGRARSGKEKLTADGGKEIPGFIFYPCDPRDPRFNGFSSAVGMWRTFQHRIVASGGASGMPVLSTFSSTLPNGRIPLVFTGLSMFS
jgi:hypothetical protein